MKAKHILTFILGAIFLPIYLSSCGEDRWAGYAEQTKTDRWIYDTMQVHYYWSEEMLEYDKANFFQEPFAFFKSLLSKEDGKNGTPYSTIDSLHTSTRSIPYADYSYGMEFGLSQISGSEYGALIYYVIEGSPAHDAGLKRGDWIVQMNGEPITRNNFTALLGGGQMELTVGHYDNEQNTIVSNENKVLLPAARSIDDNPVHYKNIYQAGDKRIGYLVYNHFTAGPTNGNNDYNRDLLEASNYFANAQVNEFILDLRYNNGGLVSCAQLLATILAPASALDKPFAYLRYNSNSYPQEVGLMLNSNLLQGGNNLNLNRLYVLTSAATASASEMIINCLKPYMEVIVVGDKTEGKNVGSVTFNNEELQLSMKPIVCKVFNTNYESDYADGFQADVVQREASNLAHFLPLGDANELLLNTALNLIVNGGETEEKEEVSATRSSNPSLILQSIDRRKTNGVVISQAR